MMDHNELREAQRALGLSDAQIAALLEMRDDDYRKRKRDPAKHSGALPLPPRAERLIRAYLAGYRPADWPK